MFAKFMGGRPEDHTRLHLALWAILHGTITLLNSKTVHGAYARHLRESSMQVAKLMLEKERIYRST